MGLGGDGSGPVCRISVRGSAGIVRTQQERVNAERKTRYHCTRQLYRRCLANRLFHMPILSVTRLSRVTQDPWFCVPRLLGVCLRPLTRRPPSSDGISRECQTINFFLSCYVSLSLPNLTGKRQDRQNIFCWRSSRDSSWPWFGRQSWEGSEYASPPRRMLA